MVVFAALKTGAWFVLLGWLALVTVYWTLTHVESAIHQAALAAQCAALAVIGYSAVRAVTLGLGEAERLWLWYNRGTIKLADIMKLYEVPKDE